MKTLLKHLGTGLALCVGTCMLGNLPVEANTPETTVNKTLSDDCWNQTSILEVARRVADWQIKDFPNNRYAQSEPRGWIAGALYMGMFDPERASRLDCRRTLHGDVRLGDAQWRKQLLRLASENLQSPKLAGRKPNVSRR